MIIYGIMWENGRPCRATDIERAKINASVTALKKHYLYDVRSAYACLIMCNMLQPGNFLIAVCQINGILPYWVFSSFVSRSSILTTTTRLARFSTHCLFFHPTNWHEQCTPSPDVLHSISVHPGSSRLPKQHTVKQTSKASLMLHLLVLYHH